MLTGRRPFTGDDLGETLAAVIKGEPDWGPVPIEARRLLRSCLQKDPANRLRDAGDWRLLLDDAPSAGAVPVQSKWRGYIPWGVACVLLAALVFGFVRFRGTGANPAAAVIFQIPSPEPPARPGPSFHPMASKWCIRTETGYRFER